MVGMLALVLSGAEAATRLYSAYQIEAETAECSLDQVEMAVSAEEASEVSDEMTPDGRPNGEPVATLDLPVAMGPDNGFRIYSKRSGLIRSLNTVRVETKDQRLFSSTSQISSSLGRQFRLVGAKPSGTS